MAITFPLSLSGFFAPLAVAEITFDLAEAMSVTETGGGEVLRASHGPRLWQGHVTVRARTHLDLDRLLARVEILRQPGAAFLVHPRHRRGPQADPEGTALGSASPTITGLAANTREITIAGLPGGYVLTEGDLIGFSYLSNPTRRALHRIMETRTATSGGNISAIEVSPPVRPGASWPRPVTLVRPLCKAVILPGSFEPPLITRDNRAIFSFAWRQTLR